MLVYLVYQRSQVHLLPKVFLKEANALSYVAGLDDPDDYIIREVHTVG